MLQLTCWSRTHTTTASRRALAAKASAEASTRIRFPRPFFGSISTCSGSERPSLNVRSSGNAPARAARTTLCDGIGGDPGSKFRIRSLPSRRSDTMPMSPTRSFNQKRRRENALRERTLPFPPSAPSHELILPCTFDRGVRTVESGVARATRTRCTTTSGTAARTWIRRATM